jgi:hypothetical protein
MSAEPKTACACNAFTLCPECYREVELRAAESSLREWLRTWGNLPDPKAPKRAG